MMALYIKQHLSNFWSSIHEKLRNTEAELKKGAAYEKKRVVNYDFIIQSFLTRRRKIVKSWNLWIQL